MRQGAQPEWRTASTMKIRGSSCVERGAGRHMAAAQQGCRWIANAAGMTAAEVALPVVRRRRQHCCDAINALIEWRTTSLCGDLRRGGLSAGAGAAARLLPWQHSSSLTASCTGCQAGAKLSSLNRAIAKSSWLAQTAQNVQF